MAGAECARSLEELVEILEQRGYELRLNDVLYLVRSRSGCITEVATPWLRIVRHSSRDGDAWYVVEPWYEALAEEIGRWMPECTR